MSTKTKFKVVTGGGYPHVNEMHKVIKGEAVYATFLLEQDANEYCEKLNSGKSGMTIERAINLLKRYNKWRRGDEDEYRFTATEIGQAIDRVIDEYDLVWKDTM